MNTDQLKKAAESMRREAAKASARGDLKAAAQYESDARAYDRKAAGALSAAALSVAMNRIASSQ